MILTIEQYETIPLVNIAREKSFALVATNKCTIFKQGWYPLNRAQCSTRHYVHR